MTCIKKRRGKYVLDYRDAAGARKRPSFDTKREAEDAQLLLVPRRRHRSGVLLDPGLTTYQYAQLWLKKQELRTRGDEPNLSKATHAQYASVVEHHLKGTEVGDGKLSLVSYGDVRDLLLACKGKGLSDETVRRIHATLRSMFEWAIADQMLAENPAKGKWVRDLRLVRSKRRRQQDVKGKAMNRVQRDLLLATAREHDAPMWELWLTMVLTGVRLGEALALRLSDVSADASALAVTKKVSSFDRSIGKPKSKLGRVVKAKAALRAFLLELVAHRRREGLKAGQRDPLLFPSAAWTPFEHRNVERRFAEVAEKAGLPDHFTPHSLRHTYASLELQRGAPIQFVQEQLGHGSIQETVDEYGWSLPKENPAGEDARDDDVVSPKKEVEHA